MLSITPDQMAAAGSYVAREYGDCGYSFEQIESPTRRVSLFHVVAGDGSRFIVAADRYGNVRTVEHGYDEHGAHSYADDMAGCGHDEAELLTRVVAEMHANAGN